MTPRSWLFIPGDSDKKLGKADGAGADALILDLEDSVAPEAKVGARQKVLAHLLARPRENRAPPASISSSMAKPLPYSTTWSAARCRCTTKFSA